MRRGPPQELTSIKYVPSHRKFHDVTFIADQLFMQQHYERLRWTQHCRTLCVASYWHLVALTVTLVEYLERLMACNAELASQPASCVHHECVRDWNWKPDNTTQIWRQCVTAGHGAIISGQHARTLQQTSKQPKRLGNYCISSDRESERALQN